jgi:hypothetical protein
MQIGRVKKNLYPMKGKIDMDLLPLATIRDLLKDRRLTVVAERSGLTHPTVKRIADGDEAISVTTWRKLSDYLKGATQE